MLLWSVLSQAIGSLLFLFPFLCTFSFTWSNDLDLSDSALLGVRLKLDRLSGELLLEKKTTPCAKRSKRSYSQRMCESKLLEMHQHDPIIGSLLLVRQARFKLFHTQVEVKYVYSSVSKGSNSHTRIRCSACFINVLRKDMRISLDKKPNLLGRRIPIRQQSWGGNQKKATMTPFLDN